MVRLECLVLRSTFPSGTKAVGADSTDVESALPTGDPVVRLTGRGVTWWDKLQILSPATLERLAHNVEVAGSGCALNPKMRQLIYIGVDVLVTHLYPSGLRGHIESALKLGASSDEIIETMQIACAVSFGSYGDAVSGLDEALADTGMKPPKPTIVERDEEFRTALMAKAGVWEPWMEHAASRAPRYLRSLLDIGYSPYETSLIGHKNRALISLSLAASPPIGNREAVRSFAGAALRFGASVEELYEAVHLTAALGAHGFSVGAPILAEMIKELEQSTD